MRRTLQPTDVASALEPSLPSGIMAWHRTMLGCGVLAAGLYVAMTLTVGKLWEGYSAASQTISELSAIGAPTRTLWIVLGTCYSVLMLAFGWIVWRTAPRRGPQRVLGALLMGHAVFGGLWPPMHQRAELAAGGATLTDTLHIAWAAVTGLLFVLETGFGATVFGRRFRVYSLVTMALGVACGVATGTYTSQVQADLPTPWLGAWERMSVMAYMLWIAILAIGLLRAEANATAQPFTADPSLETVSSPQRNSRR